MSSPANKTARPGNRRPLSRVTPAIGWIAVIAVTAFLVGRWSVPADSSKPSAVAASRESSAPAADAIVDRGQTGQEPASPSTPGGGDLREIARANVELALHGAGELACARPEAALEAYATVFREMAHTGAYAAALGNIQGIADSNLRTSRAQIVVTHWANHQPEAVGDYLLTLGDPILRDRLLIEASQSVGAGQTKQTRPSRPGWSELKLLRVQAPLAWEPGLVTLHKPRCRSVRILHAILCVSAFESIQMG